MDLFAERRAEAVRGVAPLAVRMRPRTLDEVVGQRHILGEGKLLRRMLAADAVTSLILHGPPGTGKTTLAEVIANATERRFVRENAASVGVKRIRELIDDAVRIIGDGGPRTILFLDEIHRFTKSQQDVLLGDVERGTVTLIGATTENPLFACNSALVSRSTLFRVEPLSVEETTELLRRAIADNERGYGKLDLRVDDEALRVWAVKSDGDARRALTALEVAVLSTEMAGGQRRREEKTERRSEGAGCRGLSESSSEGHERAVLVIDRRIAEESIQQKAAVYDRDGDQHYDNISAMIKSVRGSDPDAAVYWIARMLDAGEDPRFIARRLAILASEDIGNADPRAIMVAEACWSLVERIGMPECRITLSQTAIYLALTPKSNASYAAIEAALEDVREGCTLPVPMFLRGADSSPTSDGEGRGVRMRERTGEQYQYNHDAAEKVTGQDYLGVQKNYYEPTEEGVERMLKQRLAEIRQLRARLRRGE